LIKIETSIPGREPVKSTLGSAAYDLYNSTDLYIAPGNSVFSGTGVRILEMPRNVVAHVFPRSGLAYKHSITITNAVGVIDSDYRDEIGLMLTRFFDPIVTSLNGYNPVDRRSWLDNAIHFPAGTRMAQLLFTYLYDGPIEGVRVVSEERQGGYGSTGV
jgi:dUTP pyrophosphatase